MSIEAEEIEVVRELPAVRQRDSVLLVPVMDVNTALSRLAEFQRFCAEYLQESKDGGNDGGDYGIIPGTKKKTLFKSGADKLCEVYGLYDEYVTISSVEDWERGLFDYVLKCLLKSRRDDSLVGTGLGSCSTFESKYRWRESQRLCPQCGQPAIIKGKDFNNTGQPQDWLCFAKKGGCGAKFKAGDKAIEAQTLGRIDNPDIVDLKNTALKMAKKRAKIDAVIGVTRSSGTFTQDLEDLAATAAKNAPPVTAQDITIGGPARSSGAPAVAQHKGPPPAASKPAVMVTPADVKAALIETQAPDADTEFIDVGMQANFAKAFREALPKEKQKEAEVLRHQWLQKKGFVDKDGVPTSQRIPRHLFAEMRADAEEWAVRQ